MRRIALAILLAAGAAVAADEPPRRLYNQALHLLEAKDLDGAEKKLLAARDGAADDDELRYSAAFNLGITYARRADGLGQQKPDEALAALRQSAAWFRDAARLRPGDDDARANLELVLRRAQELADKLNQGQNKLEARLARAIEDQRGLRGHLQDLMARVDAAGAQAEPTGFQEEFRSLEAEERQLVADVNAVSDLAADERSKIEGTPEDKRKDEEKVRLVQLQGAEHWLEEARTTMADARRLLLRLQGASAHRKADAALARLKRAREALEDPIAALRGVAEDELGLLEHTAALEKLKKGEIKVEGGAEAAKVPPWLTAELLADRQGDAGERTEAIAATLKAAGEHPQKQQPDDPKTRRLLAAAAEAAPLVARANESMLSARAQLTAGDLAAAGAGERGALQALGEAMEAFADLRGLIEVTHADQERVVGLLSPDAPDAEKLDTKTRATRLGDLVERNRKRLDKLQGLIEEAGKDAAAQMQEQQKQQQQQAPNADAQKALFQRAEEERKQAAAAEEKLAGDLAGGLASAREAKTHIENLRRLFFSIVEHLQELLRDQESTADQTGSAQAASDDAERLRLFGPLADPQKRHAAMAEALAQALEEQADQAGKSQEAQGADAAQKLAGAAAETRGAQAAMGQAAQLLAEAQTSATSGSVDLAPTIEQQKQAMEHVAAAIRILQPPDPQKQQDQQNQQDQQKQAGNQQQKKPDQPQPLSKEEAARRLQEIRDREAAREKARQEHQRVRNEPVEKDW